ncbi:MAG: universal stress protein [Chromatiaceae bacterium]|nr:universal stress protein [Gammaproteobacteria bacterium]MCP5300037.1 universal stress protein [Chromatiaceae bacterium]MCP5422109.1 universal stress protein [Chromatiaceae bacterium]
MLDHTQIIPRILVTIDFTASSERAFYHALALAVRRQARLTLLHTGPESGDAVPWDRFPGVRQTLTRWGRLAADAPRSAITDQLNISIAKMAMRDDDPRQGIADYLRRHPADLLVMATEGRNGLARLFNPSVAESVCHRSRSRTLLLPKHGRSFIDGDTGRSSLKRVVVAFDPGQDLRPSIAFLNHWLSALGEDGVEVTLLERESPDERDDVVLANVDGLSWHRRTAPGDTVTMLLDAAAAESPDLLVLNTERRLGMRGRMRGSRLDRLLKRTGLPVLTLPRIKP